MGSDFMTLTPSTMLALGTLAPDFSLPDVVTGKTVSNNNFADKKVLLVMFICRHCPFVQHVKDELTRLGQDYVDKNLGIVAISANDPQKYPADAPASLKEFALEQRFNFPLLFDETQQVAKAYTAACTPDFFLFNKVRRLVYRGQLDDSRPGKIWVKPNGKDLRAAIKAILQDKPVNPKQKPSLGCNIKWKIGNAPNYYRPH